MGGLIRQWTHVPTRAAVEIVNHVLKTQPGPLSTREIYKLALQEKSPHLPPPSPTRGQSVPQPPNPDHPVRSMKYLKKVVLETLLSNRTVEKIHTMRTLSAADIQQRLSSMTKSARKTKAASLSAPVDTWLWRLRDDPATRRTTEKNSSGGEVEVGEDWSHLNKRRRRARLDK